MRLKFPTYNNSLSQSPQSTPPRLSLSRGLRSKATKPRIAFPLILLALTFALPTLAQPVNLDQSKLIDGLAQYNMRDLLLHLAETGEFTDPTTPPLIQVGQYRIDYQDNTRSAEDRLASLAQARDTLVALIDDSRFTDHPMRGVWRTDLTEMMLSTYLESFKQGANGFYEFGLPSDEQRVAFETAVPLAAAQMLKADDEFTALDQRLARDTDLKAQLEASFAYYRIFDDYRTKKSAYYKGFALHYAALLPDDHAFIKSGTRESQPDAARRFLWTKAGQALTPFTEGKVGNDATQKRAQSVAGRVALGLGNARQAITDHLDDATKSTDWNLDIIGAHIARAKAEAAQGRASAGQLQLRELTQKPAIRDNLLMRLLVTDAMHRLLLEQAKAAPANTREAETNKAYSVYFDMIEDPALQAQAGQIRNLIYERWAGSVSPGDDLNNLPAVVRMAISDISRRKGMLAYQQGDKADANEQFERTVEVAQTLTDRDQIGDAIWATATYNLAYAKYILNPTNLGNLVDVVDMGVSVAEQTPQQPAATEAIDTASRIIEALHRQYAAQPGVTPAFNRAMDVLFKSGNFDASKPADDRLMYYTYVEHQAKGDYRGAADLYAKQLKDHPNYLEAQAQRLFCLTKLLIRSEKSERDAVVGELLGVADAVEPIAKQARQSDNEFERNSSIRALANAQLARAEAAFAKGDVADALAELDTFEDDFADSPDMVAIGLERRILLLVDAGKLSDARDTATRMMGKFPDAAARVTSNVLDDLEAQIDALDPDKMPANTAQSIKDENAKKAATLASAAATMAGNLAEWASKQGFDDNQLLAYQLIYLKSLRVAGETDTAITYIKEQKLAEKFEANVDVLFERAAVLMSSTDPAIKKQAAPLLNRIITGLQEPYPQVYWKAWVARLRLKLMLNDNVPEVVQRVTQLEDRFPELGGEPTKGQMHDLRAEAQRKMSGN